MEPGHEDREYQAGAADVRGDCRLPQWSPVMKTGNTFGSQPTSTHRSVPQWSPVMKTGNTRSAARPAQPVGEASMEPGHEDREYPGRAAPP